MLRKHSAYIFLQCFVIFLIVLGCNQKHNEHSEIERLEDINNYLDFIIPFDTLTSNQKIEKFNASIALYEDISGKEKYQAYHLLKMGYHTHLNNIDSIEFYLPKIKVDTTVFNETYFFTKLYEFNFILNKSSDSAKETISSLTQIIHQAEKYQSRNTYKFYDLLAHCSFLLNDIDKSLKYTHKYFENHPYKENAVIQNRYNDVLFIQFFRLNDFDGMSKSFKSIRKLAEDINDSVAIARSLNFESQTYFMINDYTNAIKYAKQSIAIQERLEVQSPIIYSNLATIYMENNQIDSALYYYNLATKLSKEKKIVEGHLDLHYNNLSILYHKIGDIDKVVLYKDSLANYLVERHNYLEKEKISELEVKYETEKKDLAINALKEEKQQQRIIILVLLLFVPLLALLYYVNQKRIKLSKNKAQLELENKKHRLEQKIRQNEMNPHFVYNSIANLQGLINADKKELANSYLLAFSKFMRDTLELNRKDFISIEDEIEALTNYLKLQQMRFENAFDYEIDNKISEDEACFIPPMLLQPLIENSIEHGFKNIDYKGVIAISFKCEYHNLQIIISDNGIGEQSANKNINKSSLSKSIVQERLDMIYNQKEQRAFFETTMQTSIPNQTQGYTAMLIIPKN